jgi:branched-chain amino acid transport system substrate-binding protein
LTCSKRVWGITFILILLGGASLLWWSTLDRQRFQNSEEEELGNLVKIGVTIANDEEWERYAPIIELAEEDIATYCEEMESPFTFEFVVRNCESQAQVALDLTKEFHENGTGLIVGHPWSGMMCHSVQEYIAENDMLLLSPSSTSPHWRIPDDNMFRLACHDLLQANVIAKMLQSRQIKSIVVIYRGDAWGDTFTDAIESEFEEVGGKVVGKVRYLIPCSDYSEFLEGADSILIEYISEYGVEHVAIELVAFSEGLNILVQALEYPAVSSISWFGTDGIVDLSESMKVYGDASMIEEALKRFEFIGIMPAPAYTEEYWALNERYENETGRHLTFYGASYYDACWLYALSVMRANSTDVTLVRDALRELARDFVGVSGPCELDENDDRLRGHYDLMGYFEVDGETKCLKCGFYNATTGEITWDEELAPYLKGEGV